MISKSAGRLAVLAAAILSVSCADGPITAPGDAQYAATNGEPDPSAIARYTSGAPAVQFAWAKAWIGPSGGSVRLLDFEIVVPPGAVSKTTQFEIRLPMDRSGAERAMAEFRPHNVTFAAPVTIRLPLRGTTAEAMAAPEVLWWNGGEWIPFVTAATADGRIETTTTHFSTYGTEDPGRGITPVGG